MITIPLSELKSAIGGKSTDQVSPYDFCQHYTQNSKDVKEGSVFIALKGNRVDGHDFINEVAKQGAIAAIVEYYQEKIAIPQIIVPSTVKALGTIGKIWKARLNIPLIAVTGSVGKTTTKEMIGHVLSAKYNCHKSRQNFNNELGVPIELSFLNRSHQCSVLEFGMRGRDQINYLSDIARPDIAVITNIGMSHIEILRSRENIALAKAEIFEGMDSNSIAVLNRDDNFFELISRYVPGKTISFGEHEESDIRIRDIQLNSQGNPRFVLNGVQVVMEKCIGKHHAFNAAATFAVSNHLGLKPEQFVEQMKNFSTPEKRGKFSKAKNGAFLLDSTYNAAPDSVKSSLYNLSEMKKSDPNIRTIAVLGDMLELGEFSEEAHKHIGEFVNTLKMDNLVTVGNASKTIGDYAKCSNWKHFDTANEAASYLLSESKEKDIILLQGSRSVSLDLIVDYLEKGGII